MQPKKLPEPFRKVIAESAKEGLTADWAESSATFCERWLKQVLKDAKVPWPMIMDSAPTARAAFEMYEAAGYAMPEGTKPQIGDILFWTGKGHGKAGHVGVKTTPTHFNENSSVHVGGNDKDARGWRYVANVPNFRVVRLWEMPKNPR